MFSFIAKTLGQVIGETVHQIGEIATDISNMPAALMAGYEEEVFTKTPAVDTTVPSSPTPTEESVATNTEVPKVNPDVANV